MTEWLLLSAKEAHMNMIRVWGGGIYESDEFYNVRIRILVAPSLKNQASMNSAFCHFSWQTDLA